MFFRRLRQISFICKQHTNHRSISHPDSPLMKLLIIGATGRTGKQLLQQALDCGHDVNAIVRNKQKVRINHNNLRLFEGNLSDNSLLSTAMQGCHAVLSTLNISRKNDFPWSGLRSPKDLLSTTMARLTSEMKSKGIRRIIFTSAWGVGDTRKDIPAWFRWLIEHSNIRYPYDDHAKQEEVAKNSDLDWTAVRPAALTNSKKPGKIIVSFDNSPRPGLFISRRDTAAFMLKILEENSFIQKLPVISAGELTS